MVIHEEELAITDRQNVAIKGLRRILSVGVQYDGLVMWFLRHEGDSHIYNAKVLIHGTGHDIDPDETSGMEFMGTHLMSNGQLVRHVWTEVT